MPRPAPTSRQAPHRNVASVLAAILTVCMLNIGVFATTTTATPTEVTPASPTTATTQKAPRWSEMADSIFQTLTLDHGLPNLTVTALAEDHDGFLWVGTQDGIARWDGYRFRIYRPKPGDAGALPDGLIHSLHVDRQGRLWIGMASGGVARYDREKDRFVTLPIGPAGLSHSFTRIIVNDRANGIWVATNNGLDHIDTATDKVTQLHHDPKDAGSLPDSAIATVMVDRKGALWVGTRKGMVRRDPNVTGNGGFVPIRVPLPAGSPLAMASLLESSDGRIWMGGTQTGIFVLDPETGAVQALPGNDPATIALQHEPIFTFIETPGGEVWAGTFNLGIAAIDLKTMRTRFIRHDGRLPTSLPNNSIPTMLRDRAGFVWIGTQRGLARHDLQQSAVLTVFGRANRPNGLSQPDAASVLTTDEGKIWVGFSGNGADIIDPTGEKTTAVQINSSNGLPPDQKAPSSGLPVMAFAATPDGSVLLGTAVGLYRADRLGGALTRVTLPPRSPTATIKSFLSDTDRVWIGGASDGLWVLEAGNGGTPVPTRPVGAEKITDDHIGDLEHAEGGSIWIGTANGLNLYNPVSHEVERIQAIPGDAFSLSANNVTSILRDRKNRLWVGTFGGGISLLTGRDAHGKPRFRQFGINEGLPNTNIDKLIEDADGRIWASTDDGLAVIDPKTFVVRPLLRADGVAIPAYWAGSGAKTAEGEILFGGAGGLTVVRPERYREWTYKPPVVVTEVRVKGKPILSNRFNGGAQSDTTLTIQPDTNSFAVEFASLDYSAPDRNRYAYRLDGFDKEWIDTDSTRRLAAYTNLQPGDYQLRLRGSNRNGVWTEKELVLPVHVVPAWYQTWWMRLVEVMIAAIAIFALVQGRTRYLRQRQRELEGQVDQRTTELKEKNQELARVNALQEEEQSELTRFLAVASHDLRQPMHALNLYLGVLNNFELPDPAKPVLRSVNQCANIMDDMFLALLDLSRLDAQIVDPLIERFPVASLLANIEIEFAPQAKAKGLELRVAPCSAWIESDTALVEQILRNFTANAVRYTDSGKILIGCRRRGSKLRLAVLDTGKGISVEHQKSVFEEFCQVENAGRDRTKGLGLGLAIVRRLARLLAAPITLVSALGKGSMFAIDLPRIDNPSSESRPDQFHLSSETEKSNAQHDLAGKLIVVVDDEESILDAMRILLEQWGCIVVTAMSGDEAIERLSESIQIPDALVCDHRLRLNENGLEVIKLLQEEFNHSVPALIITGTITTGAIQEMMAIGMPLLHKPVSASALHEALVQLMMPE